jgi:hypothetical protein
MSSSCSGGQGTDREHAVFEGQETTVFFWHPTNWTFCALGRLGAGGKMMQADGAMPCHLIPGLRKKPEVIYQAKGVCGGKGERSHPR